MRIHFSCFALGLFELDIPAFFADVYYWGVFIARSASLRRERHRLGRGLDLEHRSRLRAGARERRVGGRGRKETHSCDGKNNNREISATRLKMRVQK
jgi:hypothetical protein